MAFEVSTCFKWSPLFFCCSSMALTLSIVCASAYASVCNGWESNSQPVYNDAARLKCKRF